MADYDIAAVTRRAVYSGSAGTGPYAFTFACLATSDIAVYKNTSKLTETSDYTVTLSSSTGQGSVTLGSAASGSDTITLVGARALARTTDFVTAGSLTASALNTDLDSLVIFAQQLSEENSRNLKAPVTEGISGTTDMTIPPKATRASKILEFDSDGNPAVSLTATGLSTLAGISGNITTVAGIAANVTTVAGISANVTTCAGKSSEITSVAAKASLLTADFVSDLNTLATSAIITDLNILGTADVVADLALLATSDIVSDINTLATSDVISDLNTLATSDIVTDLNLLATSANVTNMATLGASGVVANVATVAGSIANVNTTATNIAGVNSFAARYRVASSDPGSDNDAGDLVFNTSSNILKVYNGSAFEDITGSTLAGLSDTNITSPADGSILLYDTGTSKYIDNVISGDATLADTGALTIAADAITGAKIADDAIDSEHYTDGSIDTAHIADLQVTTAKIAADAITSAKIADDAISEEHLDPTIISALSDTTIASADHIMFFDATDSALKKVDAGELMSSSARPNAQPLIINGDMRVAQRGTSVSSLSSDSYAVVDRMKQKLNDAGTYTVSQSTDVPSGYGFTKSLKYDVTTAKDSPSAGTLGSLDYHVEAQDLQLLKYGTSNAQKLTFSFWVKSPKTGTHILSITSPDGNRHIAKAYTIASADTWEKHICNFDGDTSGTINDDTGSGFQLQWLLVAGSNYTSGTLATSWASYTAANAYVGQVNCADNTANNFFITGIQMEIGEYTSATIPSFQHESFGNNLARCQRYFCKSYDYDIAPGTSGNINGSVATRNHAVTLDGTPFIHADFTVAMRDNPTVTTFDYSGNSGKINGPSNASVTATVYQIGMSGFNVLNSSGSSVANGDYYVNFKAESEL